MEDITILFLPFSKNKNMEITHLAHFLEAIQKNINRNNSKLNSLTKGTSCEATPALLKMEFSHSIASKVGSVKAELTDLMQRTALISDGEPLTSIEINMLKIITSKLALLNRECLYLLDEGILTLYQDISGLLKSCSQSKIRLTIKNLLKNISESLKNLLLDHFIYQQYLSRKQNKARRIEVFPQSFQPIKGCNRSTQTEKSDAQLIQEIEKDLRSMTIPQLLKKQVKNYEHQMKFASEICRICFNKVLLHNIEEHVKICQKQNILKQTIQEKKYELAHLKTNLKRKCEEFNNKATLTQYEEDFKKISRIILSYDKTDKYVNRRSSLIARRSDHFVGGIKRLISDFIEINGEDPLLKKVQEIYKEKNYLEKKINQIEMHSLFNKSSSHLENKENSPGQSSIKLNSIRCHQVHEPLQLKEQEQATSEQDSILEDKLSNVSHELTQSQHEQDKIDYFEYKLMRSKSFCSKHGLKTDESQQFQHFDQFKQYSSLHNIIQDGDKQEITLNNFQVLKALGQGAFGKVYMVRRKETKDIYALKIIKIPQKNIETSIESIKRQHQIFKKIAGQHLVKAPFSFNQKNCQIFILEYLPGGDLRKLLNEEVYFEQERAKAYLAEIVLAIEHLHIFDIIHRDLKPENLVFDKLGHLKLTDFGLSQFQMKQKLQKSRKEEIEKETIKKTRRRREAVLSNNKQKMKLIGTPDYIAPEIIFKTSLNNFSIDWWSLGVMAYELIIGARPFCAQTIEEVIDNITNLNIQWPQVGYEEGMISPEAKDLICQLLDKDFMHRLGSNGADQIKKHPFFDSICWETVKSQKPLAIPKITNVKNCIEMQQDLGLKKQISQLLEKGHRERAVELQKFVRFDLLGKQTIETFHQVHEEQQKKLRTLKSLQQTFLIEEEGEVY